MKPLTICALLYGDHFDLAQRCLGSIETAIPGGNRYVAAFRIGLNECCPATLRYVRDVTKRLTSSYADLRIETYSTETNVCKYPLMRRIFREPEPIKTKYAMWFDDDSYFDETKVDKKWWPAMFEAIKGKAMIGQHWLMPIQGNQWAWIESQPWFNAAVGRPPKMARNKVAFEFCQGGWWVAESKALLNNDWPLPEIRHNGGDSLLGEMLRHLGLKMGRFYGGVHINADASGRHSKAARRGYTEKHVGWDYAGKPLSTAHQEFTYKYNVFGADVPSIRIVNLFG